MAELKIPVDIKNIVATDELGNLEEIAQAEAQRIATIKKRSVAGVASYVFRSFFTFGISILANLFLYAILPADVFGVWFIVNSVISLLTFLSDIGLASSLIQKKTEPTVDDLRTTFTTQMLLSLVILAVSVLLTPYWRNTHHFDQQGLNLLYVTAASFFLITFKTIPSVLLVRKLRFDLLTIPAILENIVFDGVTCFLAWKGFGLASFMWGIIARDLTGIVIMYSLQRWPIGLGFSRESFKHLVNFGAKLQLNDLLARVKDDLFTIVITTAWLPAAQVGFVFGAKNYSNMPQQFTVNNVTAITFPTFARLQHDKKLLSKAIEKTLYFITLGAFPMLAGMCLMITPAIDVFPQYAKWSPAVLSFILFSINIAWSTLSTPLTNTLNAIGEVNKTLWLMVMWTVLTWVLTPIFIHFYGYNGVALASAVIGFSSIVTVYLVKRVVSFRLIPSIWRQVVATAVMIAVGALGEPWWSRSVVWLAGGTAIVGLSFVIVFLVIGWQSLQIELQSIGLWPNKFLRS